MTRIQLIGRWLFLGFFLMAVLWGAFVGVFSLFPAGNRSESDAGWLLITAAYLSLGSAGGVLLLWAFLIRGASRTVWVKGTEVIREVAVLCAVSLGAFVIYGANPEWQDAANRILTPALVFIAVLLWSQTAGPGWTHFVEARERMREMDTRPRRPRGLWLQFEHETHNFQFAAALSWLLMLPAVIVFDFLGRQVTQLTYASLGFAVCGMLLLPRAYAVAAATGALWAKATQALRQVFAAHVVIFLFAMALYVAPPAQKQSGELAFDAISALATAGVWLLIFGPGKTAYVEVVATLAEKSQLVRKPTLIKRSAQVKFPDKSS